MGGSKIIYIDDSLTYRVFVKKILARSGYHVILANDGLAGVETAIKERPDLILMDMMMPGLDGHETTTLLRSHGPLKTTPIVALTSNNRKGDRERCLAAGCDGYIAKPIDKKSFVNSIDSYLKGKTESISHESETNYLKAYNERLVRRLESKVRELSQHNATLENKVQEAVAQLEETQAQLLQNDKLVAIGQLAAGIAHEINNPIGFVRSNINAMAAYVGDLKGLLKHYTVLKDCGRESNNKKALACIAEIDYFEEEVDIEYVLEDFEQVIKESRHGADRVRDIVQNLKDFSRVDKEEKIEYITPNKAIDNSLMMLTHELKYHVEIHKELGDLPEVPCFAGQLDQVFINLIMNAAQSFIDKGEIFINTGMICEDDKEYANIIIRDTGCGIQDKIKKRIFEPFFTTKDVGKGTGLGLSITYGIIKKHFGTIKVDSTVGVGTTFTINIPFTGVNTGDDSDAKDS